MIMHLQMRTWFEFSADSVFGALILKAANVSPHKRLRNSNKRMRSLSGIIGCLHIWSQYAPQRILFLAVRGARIRSAPRLRCWGPQSLRLTVASIRQTQVFLLKSLIGAAAMRLLLSLAVLVGILWAIDSYAFHGRYQAAALEEINYYTQTLNGGVQRFVRRFRP